MMHIPYIAPEQSQEDIDRANGLVTSMTSLIATLQKAAGDPASKYAILGKAERLSLRQRGFSAALVNGIAFFTEQVRVQKNGKFVEQNQQMVGFTSDAFDPDLYASNAIKSTLIQSHSGRCAYCETLINQNAYGDVEHFRPKAAYTTSWSPALFRPGYFNLAYDPHNLLYSCQLCNEAYKKNQFDVIGPRVPDATVTSEIPVLINPYSEDPRSMLRFNPLNGYAYAFDLAAAFYSDTQGWGPPQTSAEIWKDPAKIPGQHARNGTPISRPEVDTAYQKWLPTVQNPLLRRGTATINTLGLNRLALVRARVNQLRQLRAMFGTGSAVGPDQVAAQALVNALMTGDPGAARIAPQYLSASIDAVHTWSAQGQGTTPWIEKYNEILNAFVPAETIIAPVPSNDALSYVVLERDAALAGKRRLVYISGSDAVYGNPEGQKGIFLALDWNSELDNTVLVMRDNKVRQKMTLLDLVKLLDGKRSGYNLFRSNQLWVVGDFPPFPA
jgi:uncharacterized protein (TIGR02646 family)